MEGKCYRFGESWKEKTEIMCNVKRCIRLNKNQWKVTVKKVFCRRNDDKCVGNGRTWPLLKDGECWIRRCKIWEDNRVEITSKLGDICYVKKLY
uniref:Uncharacterized protein n=2 Tax=Octopus bimaculoides TaxID=37653 RepID=A0A0L8IEY6_OCTBM